MLATALWRHAKAAVIVLLWTLERPARGSIAFQGGMLFED
jgi:hypothetical protein